MLKTKIAVFVSGGGTNLQALIDAQKAGIIESGELALVIANNAGAKGEVVVDAVRKEAET